MSTVVLAFGIATSIIVLQRGFVMMDTARNLTTAGQIVTSQMEQLRMQDWATVSAYPATATAVTIDGVFTANRSVLNRFTVTRTVTTVSTNLLEVTFTITWRSVDGRQNSRSMTTHYARYGIHDYIYNGPSA